MNTILRLEHFFILRFQPLLFLNKKSGEHSAHQIHCIKIGPFSYCQPFS